MRSRFGQFYIIKESGDHLTWDFSLAKKEKKL